MSIDFKSFNSIVEIICDARHPIMIRGRHGIGKSQLVYQFAERIGLPIIERRASQMTEGDLIGLPDLKEVGGQKVTAFCPPDWLFKACEEPVVLFLDEVDRGTLEVRQGIFELGDSRKLYGQHLHPDTLIFAAINGGPSANQYQVGEMDPAELDRWTVFDVEPSIQDWLDWGHNEIHDVIFDYINKNRDYLEHNTDFEANKVYPSRRSWHRFSETLKNAGIREYTPLLFTLSLGFVGEEVASHFCEFYKNYEMVVDIKDIIDHGKLELVEKFKLVDHVGMIDKFHASKMWSEVEMTKDQCINLVKYMGMLDPELFVKTFNTLMLQCKEGIAQKNLITAHDCMCNGVRLPVLYAKYTEPEE